MEDIRQETKKVDLPESVIQMISDELNKDRQIARQIQQLRQQQQAERQDSESALAVADDMVDEDITYERLAGASVEDGCLYLQPEEESEVE